MNQRARFGAVGAVALGMATTVVLGAAPAGAGADEITVTFWNYWD